MKKKELAKLLKDNHEHFVQQIQKLSDVDFCYAPEGKWSAAQQLDHLVRSVYPVNMKLRLPNFILQWRFGKANRPSKTYEGLIEKYTNKLKEGGKASGRFIPSQINPDQKEKLTNQLTQLVTKLSHKTENNSEEALDTYILTHPLLGKLTLREMLYFTAYHVAHHQLLVEKGLVER